jgi:hypothetical protein
VKYIIPPEKKAFPPEKKALLPKMGYICVSDDFLNKVEGNHDFEGNLLHQYYFLGPIFYML